MFKKAVHSNTSFKLNIKYFVFVEIFLRPTPYKEVEIKANRNYYVHIPQ